MREVARLYAGSGTGSVGLLKRLPRSRIAAWKLEAHGRSPRRGKRRRIEPWDLRVSPEPAGLRCGLLGSRPRTKPCSVDLTSTSASGNVCLYLGEGKNIILHTEGILSSGRYSQQSGQGPKTPHLEVRLLPCRETQIQIITVSSAHCRCSSTITWNAEFHSAVLADIRTTATRESTVNITRPSFLPKNPPWCFFPNLKLHSQALPANPANPLGLPFFFLFPCRHGITSLYACCLLLHAFAKAVCLP